MAALPTGEPSVTFAQERKKGILADEDRTLDLKSVERIAQRQSCAVRVSQVIRLLGWPPGSCRQYIRMLNDRNMSEA
jgi:hypothetical protein